MKLWSINRCLRWTGFRLVVTWDQDIDVETELFVSWVGLYGSKGWRKMEPKEPKS